jgi:endonuclease G
MGAPPNEYSFDYDQMQRAASHWREHEEKREYDTKLLGEGRYDAVESKERLAKRVNRLLNIVKQRLPAKEESLPGFLAEALEHKHFEPDEVDNALVERVIGETRDFLSLEFVEKALRVNRPVGRIVTRLGGGRVSYGTGFLVSPKLLLTNQHVLKAPKRALDSLVEFDYQSDGYGRPISVEKFELDPGVFFLNDEDLDYALVAVKPISKTGRPLSDYGWCPLIKEEGKIRLHEAINIIQHPRGEMKQIVIRSNKLLALLDLFAHYEADTEPGSSGSPVFNDQWEVIALHHMGVPKTNARGEFLTEDGSVWKKGDDPTCLAWVANEGVRVSRLVDAISKARVQPHEKELLAELLEANEPEPSEIGFSVKQKFDRTAAKPSVTLTVPLRITLSFGQPIEDEEPEDQGGLEAVEPEGDYDRRPGYDPDFLGFSVPLPKLPNALRSKAFELPGANGTGRFELKYHHYSVLFNRERRLAFAAAVNYDAGAPYKHSREGNDRWFFDPRVDKKEQAGEKYYKDNPLDRGHLVRRADAAWGGTPKEAKLANDDTFHFTNCSPQHEIFNQSTKADKQGVKLWGNLENHIAAQGSADGKKLSISNGPIFRPDDRVYREDFLLPKAYWKVVAFETDGGRPRALAFVLSQEGLLKNLPEEEFEEGPYKTFQVKIRDLEAITKLDFGILRSHDPLEADQNESFFVEGTDAVLLEGLGDIVL